MEKNNKKIKKPKIIAEIANAHGGSIEKLFEIIDSIPVEIVNEVKFQIYTCKFWNHICFY